MKLMELFWMIGAIFARTKGFTYQDYLNYFLCLSNHIYNNQLHPLCVLFSVDVDGPAGYG